MRADLTKFSSKSGNYLQRLISYFLDALDARAKGIYGELEYVKPRPVKRAVGILSQKLLDNIGNNTFEHRKEHLWKSLPYSLSLSQNHRPFPVSPNSLQKYHFYPLQVWQPMTS